MDSLKLCVFSVKSSDVRSQTNDEALFNLMRNVAYPDWVSLHLFFCPTSSFFAIEIQLIEGVFHHYTWRGTN